MPANPRPLLDRRRARPLPARGFDDFEAARREWVVAAFLKRVRAAADPVFVERAVVERDLVDRPLLELDLAGDFFERDPWDLVSPSSRRILFTVRAATSSARPP